MISIAADPSEIWLATAAVILPSGVSVLSDRILSQSGSRGPSSRSTPSIGTISLSKRPSAWARSARSCDSTANASISSRVRSHLSTIISAPTNWLTSPAP